VKYRRLERGTFVRLTPESGAFQAAVGAATEGVLQATLLRHTALTEGDWLEVPHEGTTHRLQVRSVSLVHACLAGCARKRCDSQARAREHKRRASSPHACVAGCACVRVRRALTRALRR